MTAFYNASEQNSLTTRYIFLINKTTVSLNHYLFIYSTYYYVAYVRSACEELIVLHISTVQAPVHYSLTR